MSSRVPPSRSGQLLTRDMRWRLKPCEWLAGSLVQGLLLPSGMSATSTLIGLALLSLSIGCATEPAEPMGDPDADPEDQVVTTSPEVLRHAAGTWLEELLFVEPAPSQRCDGCTLAVHHRLSAQDDALWDHAQVIVVRSTVDDIPEGSVLCRRERAYRRSAAQSYPDGELVDYELIADTCASTFLPVALEGYALWVPSSKPALLEVMEDVPLPDTLGYRPFSRWTRTDPDRLSVRGETHSP